jgi:hypothetical protein
MTQTRLPTRAQRPAHPARDARDPTLRVRDPVRETARFSGHTFAGSPPGNLRGARCARSA